MTLEIKDLYVSIEDNLILKGLNLKVNGGEQPPKWGQMGTVNPI